MRRILILIVASLLVVAAPIHAQTTPKAMYAKLQTREQSARKAIDSGRPADGVRKDVTRVVAGYQSFVGRYPRSSYSDNALWQAAMLSASSYARFHVESDRAQAVTLLKRLSGEYPASPLVRQAKPALARLSGASDPAQSRRAAASSPSAPAPSAPVPPAPAPARVVTAAPPPTPEPPIPGPAVLTTTAAHATGSMASLRAVRRTVLPDVVRIAIELDREVEYRSDQIDDPDRVFVDLHTTSVAESVDASQTFEDELVKAVRLGPRPGGTTRVVVDLGRSAHYSVFTLYNPYRIVVDLNRAAVPGGPGTANAQPKADKVVRASEMVVPNVEPMVVPASATITAPPATPRARPS